MAEKETWVGASAPVAEAELAMLISEQAVDARTGDHVYSISLDAPIGPHGVTLGEVLPPRHELRVGRVPGLLGFRARKQQWRTANEKQQQVLGTVTGKHLRIHDVADALGVSHTVAKQNLYALLDRGLIVRESRGVYTVTGVR